jgi:hypothetical protein
MHYLAVSATDDYTRTPLRKGSWDTHFVLSCVCVCVCVCVRARGEAPCFRLELIFGP